jgi:SAM-dependent methyltransferase
MFHSSSENSPFSFRDAEDFQRFRSMFEAAGYTDGGVLNALGVKDVTSLRGSDVPLLLHRTNRGTTLDTLIRLFLIDVPTDLEAVRHAVEPFQPEMLVQAGLIEIEGTVATATVKVLPFRNLLVAFDSPRRLQSPLQQDYVMGIGSSSLTLANLTVRRHAAYTLDLGTGSGIQALLAAPHSDRVLAVDRNSRAVKLAAFNAALNGLSNIDCHEGDFFEPAQGKTFDLVVTNPPFVISPERRYIYRDSGMEGDGVCQKIVREVPRFLNEGGYCQILCNWVHLARQDWRERLAGWFEGSGCNVWVMRSETRDAATYASTWIQHTEKGEPERFHERFETWMAYYEELGIEAVSAGVITMRRSSGHPNWYRAEDAPEKMLGPCGDSIIRGFELRDFLAGLNDDSGLLDARFKVSPEVRLERHSEPSPDGWLDVSIHLRLCRGLAYSGAVDPYVANLVVRCDGRRPLRDLLAEMAAALGRRPMEVAPAFCTVVRGIIERGFLLPEHLSE